MAFHFGGNLEPHRLQTTILKATSCCFPFKGRQQFNWLSRHVFLNNRQLRSRHQKLTHLSWPNRRLLNSPKEGNPSSVQPNITFARGGQVVGVRGSSLPGLALRDAPPPQAHPATPDTRRWQRWAHSPTASRPTGSEYRWKRGARFAD